MNQWTVFGMNPKDPSDTRIVITGKPATEAEVRAEVKVERPGGFEITTIHRGNIEKPPEPAKPVAKPQQ